MDLVEKYGTKNITELGEVLIKQVDSEKIDRKVKQRVKEIFFKVKKKEVYAVVSLSDAMEENMKLNDEWLESKKKVM